MLSLLQTSLRHLYNLVIEPDEWTLDDPTAMKGAGNLLVPTQTDRWARVMIEVPVLSQKIKRDSQPGLLNTSYVIQYRSIFRFPNNLRYHDLPMRSLTDIAEYMTFLIQTHPDLLLMHPTAIDGYLSFSTNTPHVDPCIAAPKIEQPVRDELTVQQLSVNSFIPVVEMDGGKDWVCTLVWSIEVTVNGTINAYRRYFEDVFGSTIGGNQIQPRPGLTGGLLNTEPLQGVRLGIWESSPGKDTPAIAPNPQTIS